MKRRDFIQTSLYGLAAASSLISRGYANSAPNDRIQLGCIGLGGMGIGDMNDFLAHPDVDVVALCDVDKKHLAEASEIVKNKTGKQPELFSDFRDLLAKEAIQAVLVATPDHWHGIPAALAMSLGKDVYVEKPLCHNIAEGKMMRDLARKHGRITQMGTQVHSTPNYQKAAKLAQSGVLGVITQAHVWVYGNGSPDGIGNPADAPVPEELDYDFWLGPSAKRAFNPNRSHFNWRYFWEYGGGKLADFGCHYMDLVKWGMNLGDPISAASRGGRDCLKDNAETPDTQNVIFEFAPAEGRANSFQLLWSHSECNSYGLNGQGSGILFSGSEGTLLANYGTHKHFDRKGNLVSEHSDESGSVGVAGIAHKREFLDCIRSRQQCSCNFDYAFGLTTLPLLGNIANRAQSKVEWDGEHCRIIGNPKASRFYAREYRRGWTLESFGLGEKSDPTPVRKGFQAPAWR